MYGKLSCNYLIFFIYETLYVNTILYVNLHLRQHNFIYVLCINIYMFYVQFHDRSNSIKCVVSETFLIINVAVTFLYNKERFIFSIIKYYI